MSLPGRLFVALAFLLAAGPLPGALRVALVSLCETGQEMGVYVGMREVAGLWSGPGEEVELICLAGARRPESLNAGVAAALDRGARIIVVWPRPEDAGELTRIRKAIDGFDVLLLLPSVTADSAVSRRAGIATSASLPGAASVLDGVDDPALPSLLRAGRVHAVSPQAAEAWGRHLIHAGLSRLDPDGAGVMRDEPEPDGPELFSREDAAAYEERWARWLAQAARDYPPGAGTASE